MVHVGLGEELDQLLVNSTCISLFVYYPWAGAGLISELEHKWATADQKCKVLFVISSPHPPHR